MSVRIYKMSIDTFREILYLLSTLGTALCSLGACAALLLGEPTHFTDPSALFMLGLLVLALICAVVSCNTMSVPSQQTENTAF